MTRRAVSTAGAPAAIGPYSQAIAIDGLLFAAGQAGLDPATGRARRGWRRARDRARHGQPVGGPRCGGMHLGDVVKTTIFLTDMADFATVNAIYGRFVTDPPPARSTVGVAALPKGARVEIDVVARLG